MRYIIKNIFYMGMFDLSFVFVGSLSKRKAAIDIIEAVKNMPNIDLTIIGDGEQNDIIKKKIKEYNLTSVKLLGTKKNSEILNLIHDKDVFVFSSHYDGWGAVINEALTCGLYVICSDKTGAKDLLTNKTRGIVYKTGNIEELNKCINDCFLHSDFIKQTKIERKNWVKSHIHGKIIAKYFINCIDGKNPDIPWI